MKWDIVDALESTLTLTSVWFEGPKEANTSAKHFSGKDVRKMSCSIVVLQKAKDLYFFLKKEKADSCQYILVCH